MKHALILILVLVMLSLSACGGDDFKQYRYTISFITQSGYQRTYYCDNYEVDGNKYILSACLGGSYTVVVAEGTNVFIR